MRVSHDGIVVSGDKLHFHVSSAGLLLVARGVHASLEVWLTPDLRGVNNN